MKKIAFLLFASLVAFAQARADKATFDFANHGAELFGFTAPSSSSSTEGDITEPRSASVDGVTMTVGVSSTNTKNRLYLDYNGATQLRIYSGALTVAAQEGKAVTSVVFHNSRWKAPATSTGSFTQEGVWGGNTPLVTFDFDGQCRLDSVVVTYTDDSGADPAVKNLDTFLNFADTIADGAKFRFTGMAFVVLNIGKYHFLRSMGEEMYSAILYGDLTNTYKVGQYIPAGWTGVKSKVNGITVITDAEGLNTATDSASASDCEPFDFSGYLGYFSDGVGSYENDYCFFEAVGLGGIDADGRFTISEPSQSGDTATLAGENKFGIAYPSATDSGTKFNIEGILTKSADGSSTTFVPTAIKEYENVKKLWRIWYEGTDGTEYTIADSLYVVAATKAIESDCGRKNLIYVTDNATEVVDDTYAEWGWVETYQWDPDFIALDCGDDDAAYQAIAAMKVIAPATVRGVLADNQTNPRFVLKKVPTALDCPFPSIHYLSYQFGDSCWANGNQVALASGTFATEGGKEYFTSINADGSLNQPIALDRRYIGDYPFKSGTAYEMRVVFKQHEPWTFDSTDDAPAIAAPSKRSAKAAAKPLSHARKMKADDPNYFLNYSVCPLEVKPLDATVGDINGDGKVDASDVAALTNQILGTASYEQNACDINADGTVNASDVAELINIVLK